MSEENKIPKHWEIKKLGEVCAIVYGKGLPVKELKQSGYPVFGANGIIGFNDKYLFEEPQVLISCRGAASGKINLSPAKCYVTNNSLVLDIRKKDELDKKYLFYALSIAKKTKLVTGTAQPQVTINNAIELDIQFPSLPEQQAIVAKIEELLSDLENGKQQLQTAGQQLKIYRQSLLKWAFEGKLTNKNVKDGELPKEWKWVKLGDVCNKIGDIDHKMPKQLPAGYPYVSTKDFTDDLKISFNKVKYISKEDYLNLSRKIKPERGDIIFPRYGTIGKNILIDFDKEFLVSYSCAVIKPNQTLVLSKYVYLYSLSPKVTEEIRSYTVETTQANVGIASIKSFVFPLPSLTEQHRIVDELESKLTVCDKIEETISQCLKQSETLRQSILKKAFEGKLVPQNPDF